MATSAATKRCTLICWIAAGVIGLLAGILLVATTDMEFWWGGFFCALIIAIVLAFFLPLIFCRADEAHAGHGVGTAAAVGAGAAGAVAAGAGTMTARAPSASSDAAADAAAKAKADADAAAAKARADAAAKKAEADAAAQKAAADAKAKADAAASKAAADAKAKADADASKAASDAKAKADAAAKKAAADAKAAKEAELDATLGADYDGDGVREGANEGTRPEALKGPRGGKADDLKMIKGVGPKMEKMCNGLGFYHFDQIAGWSADEVAWVDANLEGFKGRVSRDTWVEQAKLLAAGGETAFSKKVGKGDVY